MAKKPKNTLKETLELIFFPKRVDRLIEEIYTNSHKDTTEAKQKAENFDAELEKNGITLRIAIAAGHRAGGKH